VRLPSFVKLLACALVAGVPSLSAQVSTAPLHYIPLPIPCRATDTRVQGGGGPIAGGTIRNFDPSVNCSIPLPSDGVIAYAVNVTAVPHGPLGYITVFPDGGTLPTASTLNSYNGVVKANAAIVSGGYGGAISVFASNTTDLVIDVSGYFTSDDASYVYVPITPCRVVDTRINGQLALQYSLGRPGRWRRTLAQRDGDSARWRHWIPDGVGNVAEFARAAHHLDLECSFR
jgi:hypothetical protein